MKKNSFWTNVELHVQSNLADIYGGYPIYSAGSTCDDPRIIGFVDGREVTRWDRIKTYAWVIAQHIWYNTIAPLICKIRGCNIEMDSVATPDHGYESWHCKRCYKSEHYTYY